MPVRHRRTACALALLTAAVAFSALACGGGGSSATTTPAMIATVAGPTGTPGPITLRIISPAEGANFLGPITLNVQATGIQIAAASEKTPGAAHFHAFLDQQPVAEGKLIPSGPGIFHFTAPVALRAAAGQHKVIVVLGDNDHVRLKGAPTAEVTFTVGPPTTVGSPTPTPTPTPTP
jgi:hypothetical protein